MARSKTPLLNRFFKRYLASEDSAAFIRSVTEQYTIATLQRLAERGSRITRRGAMLALGFVGGSESNAVLGRALHDRDRGVRLIAENGLRSLWCRAASDPQRQRLGIVIRLIAAHQFAEAVEVATRLIEEAPAFAEVYNQRAIALYQLHRYEESIDDCRQALELNPYQFLAAAGMGQCYLELENTRAALECFRRALKLNPDLEGVRAQVALLERKK
jgi:tetratricopeptide (TPR) repeat protein